MIVASKKLLAEASNMPGVGHHRGHWTILREGRLALEVKVCPTTKKT